MRYRIWRSAIWLLTCVVALSPVTAWADMETPLLAAGESEREYSPGVPMCDDDLTFTAGLMTFGDLRAGGVPDFCNAEWGFSVEFDLTAIPAGTEIGNGLLKLHQIGYAGSPVNLGVYAFDSNGATVDLQRDELTIESALQVVTIVQEPDISVYIDVAAQIQSVLDGGGTRLGLFLVATTSRVSFNDLVWFSGFDGSDPPVLTVGRADLVALPGKPLCEPYRVSENDTLTLNSWTARNRSAIGSGPFHVGYYLSSDSTLTTVDVLLAGVSLPGLGAIRDTTISATSLLVPAGTPPGDYFVGILVDDGQEVEESNEANNFVSTRVQVNDALYDIIPALVAGETEREDSWGDCENDQTFTAGGVTSGDLRVGGESDFCNSEWAASLEFDISGVPAGTVIDSATVILRQVGWAGITFSIGVFGFPSTGSTVEMQRADLTAETALLLDSDIQAAVTDVAYDVTDYARSVQSASGERIGLLLAAVPSQVGQNDRVWFSGYDSAVPPALVLVYREVSGVTDQAGVPAAIRLCPCYPNPFNPSTTIAFDLPGKETVSLRVYDVAGRLMEILLDDEAAPAGRNEVVWRGRDEAGRTVPAGVYFCRLESGKFSETKRMVLLK